MSDEINGYALGERVTWWDRPATVRGGWREPTLWLEFENGESLVVGASTVKHGSFQDVTDGDQP